MASKRKWTDLDDSDEDEPTMGKQVLPIAHLPADFRGDPDDGLQYLFMVRRDARRLPHTTRAMNPYEIKEEPLEVANKVPESASAAFLPSEEWREIFLRRFKNFRQNCTQPSIHVTIPPRPNYKIMPDRKDRDAWWAFLVGCPESEWNPPKKPKGQIKRDPRAGDSVAGMRGFPLGHDPSWGSNQGEVAFGNPAESLPTPSGTPAPPDRTDSSSSKISAASAVIPPEPTPTLMRDIDHQYAVHLLMYFAHWTNLYLEENARRYTISEAHARWMFVLLSRVDDYISADETSTLRSLARGCIGLIKARRASAPADPALSSSDESRELSGLWAQRDLWQDAEVMLSKIAS